MLTEYISRAMESAHYEILQGGLYFGEIPGFEGVLATGDTLEACRAQLREVLESWIVIKLFHGDAMPAAGGIQLTADLKKSA